METKINLYDKSNISELQWPTSQEAQQAQDLLLPMLNEGVDQYIQNVKTKLYLLKIHEQIIPITVNEREYDNSYLTSNYFPIKYAEEMLSQKYPKTFFVQRPFIRTLGLVLKGLKINKTVIVNNWLLTTNIYPQLDKVQLEAVTHFIAQRFPDHIIIFRSLNSRDYSAMTSTLKSLQYRVLNSRSIFIYDPEQKKHFSPKVMYHHRRDRRLIESLGYEVDRSNSLDESTMQRALELHRNIYFKKHTKYSPEYTERYLSQAIERGFLKMVILKKDEEIQGVMGYSIRNQTMIIPFFGYDTQKGDQGHLYRMMTILAIDIAESEKVVLNDGSGGSDPKKFRGMKPFQEYIALYDRHLSFGRRIFWGLAEKIVKRMTARLIEKEAKLSK